MTPRTVFLEAVRYAHKAAASALLIVTVIASPSTQAQTYTVLHAFAAGSDGAVPSPLIRDTQGNLYGTTKFGGITSCGNDTCGTVFKVDSAGKETVLYSFTGGSDGTDPVAGLVRDAKGNLYGTTQGSGFIGGASVIFKVTPEGQQTVLFNADVLDACCLDSPLALDAQGNLYGMSPFGGVPNCGLVKGGLGCGTLFKLSPSGKFTVLHVFKGKDGIQPEGGVVLDGKGNLYGTANFGGDLKCESLGYGYFMPGCGTIYKLDRRGKFTVLHTFTGPGDGSFPLGLIIDSEGNLYGIAQNGGKVIKHSNFEYGVGTIFKVDASSQFSVPFTFIPCTQPPCTEGQVRNAVFASHLVRDSKGNLYGLEQSNDCAKGGGCLFRIDTKGNLTDLYDFEGENEGSDGFTPMGVVLGSNGDFYGSMFVGGPPETECGDFGFTNGCGTVFKLTP
jgi:uncharacterized repeat protein (TIGR03803 family)